MESFSLLKYWRAGGGLVSTTPPNSNGPSLTAAAAENRGESSEDDDDGPFFDLEFAVPDEDDDEGQAIAASGTTNSTSSGDSDVDVEVEPQEDEDEDEDEDDVDVDVEEEEGEFNFTVSSGSSNDRTDPNLLSPSDDLFFNGKLVPIEPSSFVFNSKPQFAESLLKSATKFRVFMSGLKKSKTNSTTPEHKTEPTHGSVDPPQEKLQDNNKKQGKLFTVKLKVEEVPIVPLFTRDNSSRISTQTQKQQQSTEEAASADEKRFSKEVVQKYLKLVKPLYVRVSKRYLSLSGSPEVVAAASEPSNPKSVVKQGNHNNNNIPAGLRVVCKHLGKNRSASSAATAPSQRRDDSLLQQQDGIQSAILHCKRSFNASRETDYNPLSRKPSEVGR